MARAPRGWRVQRDTYADEVAYVHEGSDLILTVYKGLPEGHAPVDVCYVTNRVNGGLFGEYGSIEEAEEAMREYATRNPDGGELAEGRGATGDFDFTGGHP